MIKSFKTNGYFSWRNIIVLFCLCWLLVWFIIVRSQSVQLEPENLNLISQTPNVPVLTKSVAIDQLNHLIMVPGHSVVKLGALSRASFDDSAWHLLSYQRDQGFASIIKSHIQKAVEITKWDSKSLLVFSGGQTRLDVGPISEAASYYFVAKENGWLTNDKELQNLNRVSQGEGRGNLRKTVFERERSMVQATGIIGRVALEEYARDSYENLLFSVCRFHEVTGAYPSKISVVGFDFKKERFTALHRQAIHFPEESFSYLSLHPTDHRFDHEKSRKGEQFAVEAFKHDMYGCGSSTTVTHSSEQILQNTEAPLHTYGPTVHSKNDSKDSTTGVPQSSLSNELNDKRKVRNPFARSIPYVLSGSQAVKALLTVCEHPSDSLIKLPWAVAQ